MDPVKNPFNPGAGGRPPELVGRDDILQNAKTTIGQIAAGRYSRSQLLLGLRGVGKTVLLNEIKTMATSAKLQAAKVEAPANKRFLDKFVPQVRKLVLQFDQSAKTKAQINAALGAARNIASMFKLSAGGVDVSVSPMPGVADSGDLATDLTDLFVATGKAAASAKTGVILLIDELQYLATDDLSAVIVALHEVSQQNLPLTVFGAGLPQLAVLAAEANSYAERLFEYPGVGPLDKHESIAALRGPVEEQGVKFETAALSKIVKVTEGYPFFLQEWGFQAWNAAPPGIIPASIIPSVSKAAITRLDKSFFKGRFDRMTEREQDYVRAMADLGSGAHRSGEIASAMGITISAAAPIRSALIGKGMIYSPSYGETAFTVPMYDGYLRRTILKLSSKPPAKKRASTKAKKRT